MSREFEIWTFIVDRLRRGERVVLLVVAESRGSSPGRAGYKMAVAENGELIGSIGGGVMEVNLVEQARSWLADKGSGGTVTKTLLIDQEHRRNAQHPSGMICSGTQIVILKELSGSDLESVEAIAGRQRKGNGPRLVISESSIRLTAAGGEWETISHDEGPISFERDGEDTFSYIESLDVTHPLHIIGGGHCALALSRLMSTLGFHISIYDDRPSLNTLAKNDSADAVRIVESYEDIASHIPCDDEDAAYIVVMTLGYKTDAIVIRKLLGRRFKYFGVLGSMAKMATLFRELRDEGVSQEQLDAIRTPIGVPINSHSPEEIAVSIAAEIISVKNS